MTEMFTLDTLPNEIINQIFSSLSNYELARVSLVSRLFRAIAQPHLYQNPHLTRHRNSTTLPRPLQIFIRTLLHCPTLASYVRSVAVHWGRSPVGLANGPDHTLFTTAATRLQLTHSLIFETSQVILLLHLLPNLHHIIFSNWDHTNHAFDNFLQSLAFSPQNSLPLALQSLRDIAFVCECRKISPLSAITLLKLPSIRTLRISIVGDLVWRDPTPDPYAARSTVTKLVLGHCNMSSVSLARVLEMPFALTHFIYFEEGGNYHSFDCAVMRKGLETSRLTLQRLRLSIPDSLGSRINEEDSPPTIGSLSDWPVLRSIRCPLSVFVAKWPTETVVRLVDVLPRVLTKFSVLVDWYWSTDEVEGKLVELVEAREMEEMKRVTVAWVAGDGLIAACRGADVVLIPQMN